MLTLYDYLPSRNAWKVRQLLQQLGRPWQTRPVSIFEGQGRQPDFLAISPTGTVPAIELDDGRTLAESNAILMYLAEGSQYLPDDAYGRARTWQWLSFEQERIESQIGALRHWTLTGKLSRRPEALVAMKRAAGANALAILERELSTRDYIAGDRYGIADIALFAYVGVADEAGFDLATYPDLCAWIDRVRAQPGHLAQVHPYAMDPHSVKELG
ncbi:glutathione S-transferase family protein [Lysobacter sp. S4-A87]|uniref:glutathione S-transferase family protein n=1 Tax=Lysobacter sp. S4-A87 TaxID=2925843 RepID=UPI001F52BDF1|nr:glutathione S-transferase family protein [Lysobacter sp. S4-A87]UNK48217.1 glutathione S-transferase family protein [Lysobacter sp. S4-A87]